MLFNMVLPGAVETARLPAEYQEVEYIQSSGTQYIDTGYIATSENYRIINKFTVTNLAANTVLFGGGASTDIISVLMTAESQLKFYVGSGSVSGALTPFTIGTAYEMECAANNGNLTVTLNGTSRSGAYSGTLNKDYPLFVFANNVSGSVAQFSSIKGGLFQIYDNGTLVRDFVPCYRKSDGAAGFYDIVTKKFYGNAGTGVFTVGPDVNNTPETGDTVEFTYSGNYADGRVNGKGVVRLNTSGTLVVTSGTATVSVYILAGGGGGVFSAYGDGWAGSGGGGGYQTVTVELTPGTYDIVIGAGGEGAAKTDITSSTIGGTGGNTTAFGVTSTGGTGGEGGSDNKGGLGGSPNGESGSVGNTAGGSPNGGSSTSSTASDNSGGDGYVELTFI